MSEQEIIKGDKLIAEFMGVDFICANSRYIVTDEDWLEPYHHRFHNDWNWLMPLFEKIKYIEDNQEEFFGEDYYIISFEIDLLNGVDIKIDKKRIFMQTAFGEGQLIDALHGGVIEFIKWYNKNDKQL